MGFFETIKESFLMGIKAPRSPEKLKVLHGFIANDIQKKLGSSYVVESLGIRDGKEAKVSGRYMDKNVDITISKNKKTIAGIAVKFVMSNYSQNSNNYFENMLGETANLRANRVPYYQIFILPDKLPYFQNSGNITRWEDISMTHLGKYLKLSEDNIDSFYHTPNKTLFALINIDAHHNEDIKNKNQYLKFFDNNDFEITYSKKNFKFSSQTIYNDYDKFMEKIYHSILSL